MALKLNREKQKDKHRRQIGLQLYIQYKIGRGFRINPDLCEITVITRKVF